MKFEINFEFRASLRKFQDLNFWDATTVQNNVLNNYMHNLLTTTCRCFGSDRTPGVAPQGVLGVGRCRRL
jgi:hypothetical protein